MAFWSHWNPVILYWIFSIWRCAWTAVDVALDALTGYSLRYGTREEREKARKYEHSAQIVTLWGRGNYTPALKHELKHFGWVHSKYVHPRHILERDDATLMGSSNTHSFFCVTNGPDVYNTEMFPFVFIAQFVCAQQLIIVPNSTLHQLAAEIGNPDDREVIMINMTARCGSTLLCQMFAKVPGISVQSEPWAVLHLQGMYVRKEISHAEYLQLLRSVIRMQCKNLNDKEVKYVVFKSNIFSSAQVPLLKRMFPKFRHIYNTRHIKPSMKSLDKLTASMPKLMDLKPFIVKHLSFPHDDLVWWQRYYDYMKHRAASSTLIDDFTFTTSANFDEYLRTKDIYEAVIFFEDLTKDPKGEITRLFTKFNIDIKHIPLALEALKKDSQSGTFGARGTEHVQIPEEQWDRMDQIFQEYGSPIRVGMSLEEYKSIVRKA